MCGLSKLVRAGKTRLTAFPLYASGKVLLTIFEWVGAKSGATPANQHLQFCTAPAQLINSGEYRCLAARGLESSDPVTVKVEAYTE